MALTDETEIDAAALAATVLAGEASRKDGQGRGADEVIIADDLLPGVGDEEMSLADRGRHSLKGLPGEWQLYAVEPSRA